VSGCTYDLARLGATPEILDNFREYQPGGLMLARVASAIREEYRLYAADGDFQAEPTGALLYGAAGPADLPVVGDWVAARSIGSGEAIVHAVLPRRTKFSRRAAGAREQEQVIATNVDIAFIVCGLDHDYNGRRIERYLTLAAESRAEPVIILNKADLSSDIEGAVAQARRVAGGAPVIAVSALAAQVLGPLQEFLQPGETVVLLGSSGVGKSTIVNCLAGEQRQDTQEVREHDSRGRHTTTLRELIPLACGALLIDTPGMRELQLWASQDSLNETFDDVNTIAGGCRFRNCSHRGEDGCAIEAALASGSLDPDRWNSYLKLRAEIRRHELLADKQAAVAEKQKLKSMMKSLRSHPKYRR
jgi:ribosome biogenesis GTPase / thiamine phosphate phosphatase